MVNKVKINILTYPTKLKILEIVYFNIFNKKILNFKNVFYFMKQLQKYIIKNIYKKCYRNLNHL